MESLRARLLGPAPAALARQRRVAMLGILLVTVAGGALRLWRLGYPTRLVFDETYYVKQAWSLVLHGTEMDIREDIEEPDELFTQGTPDVFGEQADYVVHPPMGKWMISLGQLLLGPEDPAGWRLSSAVVGTLSITVLGLCAWLIWKNALLAVSASLLLAVDGHHYAQSRIGLLDIFLMWWALLAFLFLLLDREHGRRRLADRFEAARSRWGPGLGVRWWRLAAGVCLGLAIGTKWSGLFFLAVFGLMTVWWDLGARRAAGVRRWASSTVLRDGIPAFLLMVPTALVSYLATWTGWFLGDRGWKRSWAQEHPATGLAELVPDPLRSLWAYHQEQMGFHVDLQNEHAWSSNPWSWTVQWRPTLFYSEWPKQGERGCEVEDCVEYIASLGTIPLWWGATLGLLVATFMWLLARDWRAGAALSGVAAGWLPWFLYQTRTIYSFYAVAFVPWLVLVVVTCLALVLGRSGDSLRRRRLGAVLVVVYLTLTVAWFAWYWPVHSAVLLPRPEWNIRLFFDFWN